MASTSVHIPEDLVDALDRIAAERGVSRNRVIVEACRRVVRERDRWPTGFFSNDHLASDEIDEIERSAESFLEPVVASRRNRTSPSL